MTHDQHQTTSLRRMLGAPTALFVGMGVAIGSGIFRVPGEVAANLPMPGWIVLAWVLGGAVNLMQGLVTAELATRHPRAGGEYVYLREAYGEFAAFFFGWAFTLFVVGGGAASIAAALGDFAVELWDLEASWSGYLAAVSIIVVTGINAIGLRVGATIQNILTVVKIAALVLVIVVGIGWGGESLSSARATAEPDGAWSASLVMAGFMAALWPFLGTTDAAMLAEEVKDVRRAIPRALIVSSLSLTALYVLFNVALMRVIPVAEMGAYDSVPGEAMGRVFGPGGRSAMLVVAILICLSTLSSTVLATIRVTFALARDGLAFKFMARMSRRQAPVPALLLVGAASTLLVLTRGFEEILSIYFLAAAILFGLTYGSLLIFRRREAGVPDHVFRCPMGIPIAIALIALELALAAHVIWSIPYDAARTLGLLAALGVAYFVWKWVQRRRTRPVL